MSMIHLLAKPLLFPQKALANREHTAPKTTRLLAIHYIKMYFPQVKAEEYS